MAGSHLQSCSHTRRRKDNEGDIVLPPSRDDTCVQVCLLVLLAAAAVASWISTVVIIDITGITGPGYDSVGFDALYDKGDIMDIG